MFGGFVADEEEGCPRSGPDQGGAHARVNAREPARGPEAGRGLEARFQRVDGVEA